MTLLKYENAKLKHQLIFNLPAIEEVCGRMCPSCYAAKAQTMYPAVLPYRTRMLEASKQPTFADTVISDIRSCRRPLVAVRIHESGEFYSQDYINSWAKVVHEFPTLMFYAFTKRMDDFDFKPLRTKANMVLINSLMFNRINYGTERQLREHPIARTCPATVKATKDTTICGITCTYCMTKEAQYEGITFVKH